MSKYLLSEDIKVIEVEKFALLILPVTLVCSEFDHRIFKLLKQQRERHEKFKAEWGF